MHVKVCKGHLLSPFCVPLTDASQLFNPSGQLAFPLLRKLGQMACTNVAALWPGCTAQLLTLLLGKPESLPRQILLLSSLRPKLSRVSGQLHQLAQAVIQRGFANRRVK